ncbi:MAG: acyltransferase, partial [Sphingobacteriales bacterium]
MREDREFIYILRFLLASMVALFHFNQSNIPVDNWYRNVINFGWLGVPVFFVISGYYIAVSATNCKTARDFAVKRLFRIFPAYWISLIIVLIAAFFAIVKCVDHKLV